MVKNALIIGINYKNTTDELYGCINDAINIRNFLTSKLEYTNFIFLTDDTRVKPTRINILKAIDIFVRSLKPGDHGWFHFSGHGILQRDFNNDEVSGHDSCMVPIDHNESGVITDDIIRKNLVEKIPIGVKLYIVLDACHSGTGADHRYKYNDLSFFTDETAKTLPTIYDRLEWTLRQTITEFKKYKKTSGEVYCISGCEDPQFSADGFIERDQLFGGALTSTLLLLLNSNDLKSYKWKHLLKDLSCSLKVDGYDQQPTITSGKPINMENSIFEEIQPKFKVNKETKYSTHFFNKNSNNKNSNNKNNKQIRIKTNHTNRMNINYGNSFLFKI